MKQACCSCGPEVLAGRSTADKKKSPRQELALCRVIVAHHTEYLAKHSGIRPRKPESMHVAIHSADIAAYEGKWEILKKSVRPVQSELTPHRSSQT
jgi:hypothetical protein